MSVGLHPELARSSWLIDKINIFVYASGADNLVKTRNGCF
jgi:hypothetical protein